METPWLGDSEERKKNSVTAESPENSANAVGRVHGEPGRSHCHHANKFGQSYYNGTQWRCFTFKLPAIHMIGGQSIGAANSAIARC